MSKELFQSQELLDCVNQKHIDYQKVKEIIDDLFCQSTELSPDKHIEEFCKWLREGDLTDHPLFFNVRNYLQFPMFIDLFGKINKLAQPQCEYCSRGSDEKYWKPFYLDIDPVSQSTSNKRKNKKVKEFKEKIKSYFQEQKDNFRHDCRICLSVLFIFGKKEAEKDCDNMVKALNDGLNDSLISDDAKIDHLNIMKIKTNFKTSSIMLKIRESHLNEHNDVILPEYWEEPIVLSKHLERQKDNNDKN